MSHLYQSLKPRSDYVDRKSGYSGEHWERRLQNSTTVYVGNLTFFVTEDQLYELFSKCGEIDLIVMGLNRKSKVPCGFCFVKYYTHAAANRSVEYLNGIQFDNRRIRVDWDSGEGIGSDCRKFGRGVHGLQWRDEFRTTYDPGRGGEGGQLDYATFCATVRPNRNKRSYRHWDRYGDPNRPQQPAQMFQRNVRPRYRPGPQQHVPYLVPKPDHSIFKPDFVGTPSRPAVQDIKPNIGDVMNTTEDLTMTDNPTYTTEQSSSSSAVILNVDEPPRMTLRSSVKPEPENIE